MHASKASWICAPARGLSWRVNIPACLGPAALSPPLAGPLSDS